MTSFKPEFSTSETEYFIQTRREIDTEKQERNKLLNYGLLATGAFALALAQIERSTVFLSSPWALGFYYPLLILISAIVAARRMKLHQIFDRWITLYSLLQTRTLTTKWKPLEETVIDGIKGRRYLYEDLGLHLGLSAIVYGLIVMTMIRLLVNDEQPWLVLAAAPIPVHLVLSTIWLLRPFKFPDRVKSILSSLGH